MSLRKMSLAVATGLLCAVAAFAQSNATGTISGRVLGADGAGLPGVTVTVSSSSLQGVKSVVTSTNGDYVIPFLPAGDYTATFTLTGFQTAKRELRVKLAESIAIDQKLSVQNVSELVTVTAEGVADFSLGTQASTSYKAELMGKLPTARTLLAAVDLAPGVHATGPSGNRTISGGMSFENVFLINGVVAQDNIRNTPFNLFIEDALQETTVSTAAVSAEYGRFGGGVVNAITKSGGDTFSGSFRTTFDNDDWIALTPFPNDVRSDKVIPTYEATFGGPIIKQKLWFFGAGRMRDVVQARTTASFTNIPFEEKDNEKRIEGKLTYSFTANHTFKAAYTNVSREQGGNTFPSPSGILDMASLVNRSLPQKLLSLNYTGVMSPKFYIEAQFSKRQFTFENSGSQFTDLIKGTLVYDRQRNNQRYHSPQFCGVCVPEGRDNENLVVKASYFLSTGSMGSHNVVFGFDAFNDQRQSDNHQSGSDYSIFGTTTVIRGQDVFPVFLSDRTTFIQWNPIDVSSQGNNFKTYSGFVNDAWRFSDHLSFNVGLRYDKNSGKDATGNLVVKDSAISPRLAVAFDPRGDGVWTMRAGYAKYVAAIANSQADAGSAGGRPANYQWDYVGPAINPDANAANLVSQDAALAQLFAWFQANGGTDRRPLRGSPTIPGLTTKIGAALASPANTEWTVGVSRRLGSRGAIRLDGVFRDYNDFYTTHRDLTTGRVTNSFGQSFDLAFLENTDGLSRKYEALNAQITYGVGKSLNLGANYTLSHAYGNVVGENAGSGPISAGVQDYPEYFQSSWNFPTGDLSVDQRHRARVWGTYLVPLSPKLGSLDLGLLEQFATGTPYGANGLVDTRPFVTNPGYVNPPSSETYWFTARDAFRTDSVTRTDLALNYAHKLGLGQKTELFFRGTVLNVFNEQGIEDINNLDTSVLVLNNTARLAAFNPFTTQPVQNVNWELGPNFGKPVSRLAYQTPRTYQFSVGFRF